VDLDGILKIESLIGECELAFRVENLDRIV